MTAAQTWLNQMGGKKLLCPHWPYEDFFFLKSYKVVSIKVKMLWFPEGTHSFFSRCILSCRPSAEIRTWISVGCWETWNRWDAAKAEEICRYLSFLFYTHTPLCWQIWCALEDAATQERWSDNSGHVRGRFSICSDCFLLLRTAIGNKHKPALLFTMLNVQLRLCPINAHFYTSLRENALN